MVNIARNHRSTDTAVRASTPPFTAAMPPPPVEPPAPVEPPLTGAGHTVAAGRVRPDDRDPVRRSTTEPSTRAATAARYLLAGIRLALGWVFLWAFLDKAFGLGFATPSERSWVTGGSPTNGFLASAKGPFSGFYHSIAGTGIADALIVLALLGAGNTLGLGRVWTTTPLVHRAPWLT